MEIRDVVREIITRYASPRYQSQEGPFARFNARDPARDVEVAIDVLPKILGDSPEMRRRFELLGRAVQYMEHPYIRRTLEVAQERGIPYIVSEAVRNVRSLADSLTSEPMDLERAGELVNQIGRALEYAGQQGVPHGSLTPEDVLIDENETPLVANLDPANPDLAPEQRLPDHVPTTRADVYSLAAIMFRLITGLAPDADMAPERGVRADELNEEIPPAVADVLQQALSPDPLQRPQSPDDFLLALRSAIRSPRITRREEEPEQPAPAETKEDVAWPAPAPFPDPITIEPPDMSALNEATRVAQEMLQQASELIPMPKIELTRTDE